MANDGFIGFEPSKVSELMTTIADSYEKLGSVMSEGWANVSQTMQGNWKGVDEQDYEEKLAQRINVLYVKSTDLVNAMIDTIKSLGDSWNEFQKANVLTTDVISAVTERVTYEFTKPTLRSYDMKSIVKLKENSFSNEALGIAENGSANIKLAIENYQKDVQDQVKAIYDAFDAGNAFYGTQTTSINEFMKSVGETIKNFVSDINDLFNHIDKLAGASYEQANSQAINVAKKAIDQFGNSI